MNLKRHEANPLIKTAHIKASSIEYEVVGAFNPGASVLGDETILLVRVAERCTAREGVARVPIYRFDGETPRPWPPRKTLKDSSGGESSSIPKTRTSPSFRKGSAENTMPSTGPTIRASASPRSGYASPRTFCTGAITAAS